MLLTTEQCFALFDKYEMPQNIRKHTLQVVRVADAVAAHIMAQGFEVDAELVNRGALLHDIAKMIAIRGRAEVHHTKEGAKIILKEGLNRRLASVVLRHGLDDFSFDLPIEDQIVNYADRRVAHDLIVSLEKRLDDLKERYPNARPVIKEKTSLYYEFEKRYKLNSLVWLSS